MAGILPFYLNPENDTLYYLIARESHTHPSHAGLYSDFGGAKDDGETNLETAAREGYEESMGFFGKYEQIKKNISHKPECMKLVTKSYTTYLFYMDYCPNIIKYMNYHFNFIKINAPHLINETNCIYEKDHFMLKTLDELSKNEKIRPFYKSVIEKIDEAKIKEYIATYSVT